MTVGAVAVKVDAVTVAVLAVILSGTDVSVIRAARKSRGRYWGIAAIDPLKLVGCCVVEGEAVRAMVFSWPTPN